MNPNHARHAVPAMALGIALDAGELAEIQIMTQSKLIPIAGAAEVLASVQDVAAADWPQTKRASVFRLMAA
jgi:hypothetical protein